MIDNRKYIRGLTNLFGADDSAIDWINNMDIIL